MAIKNASPSLIYLNHILSVLAGKQISVPSGFLDQVRVIQKTLSSDASGLINSLLDFAISAATVDFSVESSNKTLHDVLNDWIQNINSDLRGKIPTGIQSLAKEYYRERWKNSSLLILRVIWENKNGYILPTKLWFVDGGDVSIENDSESKIIGNDKYKLAVSKDKKIALPYNSKETIFIQKPFEAWSADYPVPFLIRRGIWENSEALRLITDKGTNIVGKALEYMLLMKKGHVDLAKLNNSDYTYTREELKQLKEDLQKLIDDSKSQGGTPLYTSNFDTNVEHLIPEFEKAINQSLYHPFEKRILAGLGFVEVLEGISTRRDSILNPKSFISEVYSAVNDFKILLNDVLMTIIEKNKQLHRKTTNADLISIRTSPVKQFYTDDAKALIRSLYDRGLISKRTTVELGVDIDFDAEIERRKREQSEGLDGKYDFVCYPPLITNQESNDVVQETPKNNDKKILDDRIPGSPEAKNFNQATVVEKSKKRKKKSQMSIQLITFTSGENAHTHNAEIEIFFDKKGDILKIEGQTDIVDGHRHSINELHKTEISENHSHELKTNIDDYEDDELENSNVIDKKILLKKLEILQKQDKLLNNLIKEDKNETTQQ
ncbi:MAG: hypothetical protein WC860_07085 [Candidatus Margulisiibacteriota bacterium]|jgi:hypothetical protein